MIATIAQQLKPHEVDFTILEKNYRPLLSLVHELIGVVPNADPILEIWPTGFKTYNLLVPNLLNLPVLLWKNGAQKQLTGLAMYASSREAGCSYCTAHCCSFALRRGIDPSVILGERSLVEDAVVSFAEGLSSFPLSLTHKHYHTLSQYLDKDTVEWIALSVGLMGFLNKFMDAMGIELEKGSLQDVGKLLSETGWNPEKHMRTYINLSEIPAANIRRDNIKRYFNILKLAPRAIAKERKWMNGVPDTYPETRKYLEKYTGYGYPMLKHIQYNKVLKTITSVIKDNLDPVTSVLGIKIKHLCSLIYFTKIKNRKLKKEATKIVLKLFPEIDDTTIEKLINTIDVSNCDDSVRCEHVISEISTISNFSKEEATVLLLAGAMSYSPSKINVGMLGAVSRNIRSTAIVELTVWISIQQLLHRLQSFYKISRLK